MVAIVSRERLVKNAPEICFNPASVELSKIVCSKIKPNRFLSSVTKPMPFFIASKGEFIFACSPSTKISHEFLPCHAPKIVIKSSLRPAPINPAMPRTSPFLTEKETSSTSFLFGLSASKAVRFLTSKTVSPNSCKASGKISPTSRPTIKEITLFLSNVEAFSVPTVFPSRKTVIRSLIINTSSSLCEM